MNVQYTEKIESIFYHTLLLIKENGFHGTPMSQIAKQSDVAVGTIYHYFPSKEELIIELFYNCKRKLHTNIFDGIEPTLSYKDRFELVFSRFCNFYIDNPIIFSFMEQFYCSPFFEMQNCNEGMHGQNLLLDFLEEGIKKQHLKKIELHTLAAAFIGTAVSFSKSILHRKVTFDENDLKDLITIIWQGAKHEDEI